MLEVDEPQFSDVDGSERDSEIISTDSELTDNTSDWLPFSEVIDVDSES